MNEDILKGQWKQIRGQIKEWWSVLTDDDLDKINGRRDRLIGHAAAEIWLHQRPGHARTRRSPGSAEAGPDHGSLTLMAHSEYRYARGSRPIPSRVFVNERSARAV